MKITTDNELSKGVNTLIYMLKTLYVIGLFLLGMWLFLTFAIGPQDKIFLRQFPYPYKAAISLCNDLQGTDSPEEFLAIQRYLNTKLDTPWGRGLGIETGNTMRFFDLSGKSNFTIFHSFVDTNIIVIVDSLSVADTVFIDTSYSYNIEFAENRTAAKVLVDFIKAGYIDGVKAYGNASQYGFDRNFARKALEFSTKNQLKLPIWINDANPASYQNIGKKPYQQGDNPSSPYYHTDFFPGLGIEYINLGGYTAMIGQESQEDVDRWFKKQWELLRSAWSSTKVQKIDLNWNNRLLNRYNLRNGQSYFRFRRFINPEGTLPNRSIDAGYIQKQITPEILDVIIEYGGFMVLDTRLGANSAFAEWIPEEARDALALLSRYFEAGEIIVTTPSRMLDYFILMKNLQWTWKQENEAYIIEIDEVLDTHGINYRLEAAKLQGITFYTPHPERTRIFFSGKEITPLQINFDDHTGKSSVSIPWKWLSFPPGY